MPSHKCSHFNAVSRELGFTPIMPTTQIVYPPVSGRTSSTRDTKQNPAIEHHIAHAAKVVA